MRASALRELAYADTRLLWRDPLLKWIVLLPVGLALLFRVLIPRTREALVASTGFDIAPYYPLVLSGYLMTAPGIVGMVIGFLLLDERDARTLTALRVTPLSMRRYLAYRVALPLLIGTGSTLVGYPMIGISPLPFATLLAIAVVAALSAPLIAFVLAAAAPNKVAGFAVVKVLNGVNLLPIAAYFLPTPLQYVAGIIPTYWPMRAMWSAAEREEYVVFLAIGAVTGTLALVVSASVFERRLLRHG
jgi:fluoroquinolone transport system permease protein